MSRQFIKTMPAMLATVIITVAIAFAAGAFITQSAYAVNNISIKVSVVDADSATELSGAMLKLNKDGTDASTVLEWMSSGDKPYEIEIVTPGDYILRETSAPLSYEKVKADIKFNVSENGKITLIGPYSTEDIKVADDGTLILKNKVRTVNHTIKISKVDAENNEEIFGAGLIVTKDDADNTPVDSWTSSKDETHEIPNVAPGKYILKENSAPDGYEKVDPAIKFTVAEDGEITVTGVTSNICEYKDGKLILKNKKKQEEPSEKTVYISKAEISNGSEIEGATLVVTKDTKDGEAIASWISGKVAGETGPHKLSILPGRYVLSETLVPDDFHLQAESITFSVDEDGTITLDSGTAENYTIVMIDNPAGALKFTVEEEETGDGVKGAIITITTMKTDGTTETKPYTTDRDGMIYIPNLPVGNDYSYKYTTIPEKYVVSSMGEETGVVVKPKEVTEKTIKIKKNYVSTPTEKQKPTARDLTENGKEQELITAAESLPEGCKAVEYSTDDGKNWSEEIPVGKEAGEYTIRVRYVADENHFTIEGEPLTVTIKAVHTITKPKPTTKPTTKAKPSAKASKTPLTRTTATGDHSMTVGWAKVEGAAGYEVFFSRCDGKGSKTTKKVKTIKGNKTFTWTKSGLKKGTAYKAYVKAYTMKNGKKTYIGSSPIMHAYTGGASKKYTNAKSISVNKTKVELKKGKTFKIKAKVKKLKKNKKLMPKTHVATIRYLSTDKKIATVSKKGKITAKGKGTCYVYAYAHNGVYKKIKVTVK